MFESLSKRLDAAFQSLGKGGIVTEKDVENAMRDVRLALLEADVALPVVKDFVSRVKEKALGAEVHKALRPAQQVVKIVHDELIETLGESARLNFSGSTKPYVIMLVGLQGSGKTTTAAKLAVYLRSAEKREPFMIAADTYRPAAVDQLVTLAKQIGVPYYEEGVQAKPPDIVTRGLKAAKDANAAVAIVDTAGRLQIDENLMQELEEIKRRTNPAEILLVADSMTGQEAVNIAKGFNERLGITGMILTKVDGDARGGAAISMRAVANVPIKFLGTSEKTSGFEIFHPDRLVGRILGMGDTMSLIEKATEVYDEQEALKLEKKIMQNNFTLQDFLDQLRNIRKMGSLTQILGMIPGMSRLQDQIDEKEMEKRIKRVEAIICSMTARERDVANPHKFLDFSRKKRIAKGSGVEVREINDLLKQFQQMQTMMGQMRKGKMPKFPGLPGGMR